MTPVATVAYDRRVDRLAAPQRSPLTAALVDPADRGALEALLDSVSLIESHRAGDRAIVPPEEDYVGEHRDYVLAPFAYRSKSRFSNGSYGVLYAAETRETALREIASRLTRIYEDGSAPAQETRKQHLTMRIVADLADIKATSRAPVDRDVYHESDYAVAQRLGAELRERYPGLTYDSVRDRGGVCVGAFLPRIISDVQLASVMSLVWDGTQFSESKTITPL